MNQKKRKIKKFNLKPETNQKLKKAWDYGVAVFCIANNGAYILSQKELVKCLSKDIYLFSKDKAKKIAEFQKNKMQIKKLPSHINNLMKRLNKN